MLRSKARYYCVSYICTYSILMALCWLVHKETSVISLRASFRTLAVNCLDRHVHTCPERVALIWERDERGSEIKYTYRWVVWSWCCTDGSGSWSSWACVCRELLEMTCRLGNLLRRHGVKRGDCVTIYMPACPLAVASMLACARIGAAHNVVFAGFSADALAERIRDGEMLLLSS